MELGIYSFGERTHEAASGRLVSAQDRLRDLIEINLADEVGLDVCRAAWPPPTRERFNSEISARGALFVGNPQRVIDKVLFHHELFGHDAS